MAAAPPHAKQLASGSPTALPIHDIPSLDGLRALSIAIVVLSHTRSLLPARLVDAGLFRYLIGGGLHGVQIFYVLSGYLITTLLLREQARTGTVSFRRFYARRALRIFPAFYAYFALLALLSVAGVISIHWPTYLASAVYAFVYVPHPQGWYVEHTWSLSIEEQFYLLWPALLVFAHRRRISLPLVLSVLATMPLIRAGIAFTSATPERMIVTLGSIDTLMSGCLLALITERNAGRTSPMRFSNGFTVAASLVLGFLLVPFATAKIRTGGAAILIAALGASITAAAIGVLVAWVVAQPHSLVGRFLNLPLMRHIGVSSYSIYLWQQLFTADPHRFGFAVYLLILAAAGLSYWLIEKPMMRLRERLT